jgi:hypothetical protein
MRMMSKTKKWIACLVAALLVLQIVPAYMGSYESEGGFNFSNAAYRDALDIGSDESTTALAGSKITLRANEDYTPVWTSGDESKATVESSEPTHSVTVAINEDADDYVDITATAGDQSRTIRINIENPTKYNDGQKTNDGLTNIVIMVTGKTEAVTYDGQEHVLTGDGEAYTLSSNNSGFDSSKVSLVGEPKTLTKKDCGLYALGLDSADFQYNDDSVKATFIIKDAYLKINAKKVTVKPNDVEIDAGETPNLTATVSGLVEGESEDLIHYTLSTDAGDYSTAGEYTITAVLDGEEVQGNYRVNCKQTGKLTVIESEWTKKYELYNLAVINGKWYRLRKTTIRTKQELSVYTAGIKDRNQSEVDKGEYKVDDYDFENEIIEINQKTYYYQGKRTDAELDPTKNYYKVQYEVGGGNAGDHQVIFAAVRIGGGSGMLAQGVKNYTDKDQACLKRNYVISLNEVSSRKYTITFIGADGQKWERIGVKGGSMPSIPNPTKKATTEHEYVFIGWDKEVTAAYGDATYTAQFEEKAREYTITWKDDSKNTIDTTKVAYGETPTHDDPVKDSDEDGYYTFKEWTPAIVPVTQNTTYNAKFDKHYYESKMVDLYNLLEANGKFYRLRKTKIYVSPENTKDIGQAVDKKNYQFEPYDFSNANLTIDGVTYIYSATELDDETVSYYTVSFQNVKKELRINQDKDWHDNHPEGWIDGSQEQYGNEDNETGGYHANYKATLHRATAAPKSVSITSNWPSDKVAYEGAQITLTATLEGFGSGVALQWQHSTDKVNWVNEPDATGMTFTYTLNEETASYSWRVVANE